MLGLKRTICAAVLVASASPGLAQGTGGVSLPSLGLPGGISSGGGGLGGLGGSPIGGGTLGGGLGGLPGTLGGSMNDLVGLGSGGGSQIVGGRLVSSTANQLTTDDIQDVLRPNLSRMLPEVWVKDLPPETLLQLRRARLAELVRQNRDRLEMDAGGNPVARARVIVIDPANAGLSAMKRAGFAVISDERDQVVGMRTVVMATPRGLKSPQALQLARRVAPALQVELDHIFEPAGGALAASSVVLAAGTQATASGVARVGMVDGGVAQSPALASVDVEQQGFAGAAQATGHGTAVASLIAGSDGKFRGAAPGTALLVADVYGGNPAAGSATVIAKALSWLAARRPGVINISLVGPRNRLVEHAVAAVQARGIKVVAAVGNDGPAAPPLYPASQAGVIAVTGVDAANRALREAGRTVGLDYAGPGADMAAALPGKGYTQVRGTSFAAPFVTGRLALRGSTALLDSEASKKGFGQIGRGIVCGPCRVSPRLVKAK